MRYAQGQMHYILDGAFNDVVPYLFDIGHNEVSKSECERYGPSKYDNDKGRITSVKGRKKERMNE